MEDGKTPVSLPFSMYHLPFSIQASMFHRPARLTGGTEAEICLRRAKKVQPRRQRDP
jgi:hypothetical protein